MTAEEMKTKVRRVHEEGINKDNLAVFDELYAADVMFHHPNSPQKNLEGLKAYFEAARIGYPDMHETIHDLMAAEGDKVVARFTWEGTNTGEWPAGARPTGKHVRMTLIGISRFAGGKIVEEWYEGDFAGAQKQLQG
jgi:predicted ester cyclase